MTKVAQLRQRRAQLLKSLQERHSATKTKTKVKDDKGVEQERDGWRAMTDEERAQYEGDSRELENVKLELEVEERAEELNREELQQRLGQKIAGEPGGPFRSLGEQLLAVRAAAGGHGESRARLIEVRAPLGSSENIDSDGGYLVQKEFVADLYSRSYQLGQILPRVKSLPIGANANGIVMNGFEDSNLANGVMGGILAYWDFEAGTVTGSKPKFRHIEMKLQKVRALCYATDEMLEDATTLEGVITEGVPKAIQLKVENSIFNGTGAGQCLGILNAGAKVQVPKESGQTAATINYTNVLKMWNRMIADSRANAIWWVNQEVEPQLMTMAAVVGVGGVPVWLPAGGASAAPFSTLFGRPVIPVQYTAALGTEGDIVFADLAQYLSINKGPVQAATSIHVQFITGEQAFRFTYRINGQPLWDQPFTPLNGTTTYSPIVTLATRG